MCAIKVSYMVERFKEKAGENKDSAIFNMDDWIATTLYAQIKMLMIQDNYMRLPKLSK